MNPIHHVLLGTGTVSLIIPVEGAKNKFVITIDRKLALITWDGVSQNVSSTEILGQVENEPEAEGSRFNDGKTDPTGRLWLGTMGAEPELGHVVSNNSSLYSFDNDKTFKTHLSGITISNGLAWNRELKKFYYIDSPERKVFQFDYDENSGSICKCLCIIILAYLCCSVLFALNSF